MHNGGKLVPIIFTLKNLSRSSRIASSSRPVMNECGIVDENVQPVPQLVSSGHRLLRDLPKDT